MEFYALKTAHLRDLARALGCMVIVTPQKPSIGGVLQMLLLRSSQPPADSLAWQRLMIMVLKKIKTEDRARRRLLTWPIMPVERLPDAVLLRWMLN